jgi:hypothetical protein
MQRAEDYLRRAKEMEAIAERLPPGLSRDECLLIARHWRQLADEVSRGGRRGP